MRALGRWRALLPAALWMALIVFLVTRPADFFGLRHATWLGVPRGLLEDAFHAGAFALLAVLLRHAIGRARPGLGRTAADALALLAASAASLASEVAQMAQPSRAFELSDLGANLLGTIAALALYRLLRRWPAAGRPAGPRGPAARLASVRRPGPPAEEIP